MEINNIQSMLKDMEKALERIKYLVSYLNDCTIAYDAGNPKISDKEWDDLYFELLELENFYGYRLENSPTQIVYFSSVSELKKVTHNHAMLSLEKTKDLDVVRAFAGNKEILAMCKMDGLTCSLTYRNGRLVAAETRGNGTVGEDILHNAMVIPSIPKSITYREDLVVDGEIICKSFDFAPFAEQYKNPRNFAAGSIRLLNNQESANRSLSFVVWDVIKGFDEEKSLLARLGLVSNLGLESVFNVAVQDDNAETIIRIVQTIAHSNGYPIDGVVLKIDDYDKRMAEQGTSHHLGGAIAYKFYDEEYTSYMRGIDWTMGRTGDLTPVAVFEPIDMDGSVVERASLHNVSIMKELFHGDMPFVGQEVKVFKANMIIPQIASTQKINPDFNHYIDLPFLDMPEKCPVCGGEVAIRADNESEFLYCTSATCPGKLINRLDHFCGKKGLDIKGLSKATLTKLTEWGWVENINDLPKLVEHKDEWIKKPGFGAKSVQNILDAIEIQMESCYNDYENAVNSASVHNLSSHGFVDPEKEHLKKIRKLRKENAALTEFVSKSTGPGEESLIKDYNEEFLEVFFNYKNISVVV